MSLIDGLCKKKSDCTTFFIWHFVFEVQKRKSVQSPQINHGLKIQLKGCYWFGAWVKMWEVALIFLKELQLHSPVTLASEGFKAVDIFNLISLTKMICLNVFGSKDF